MLVLTRKAGESIVIDGNIVIHIGAIHGKRVKVSIDAPRSVRVVREEKVPKREAS